MFFAYVEHAYSFIFLAEISFKYDMLLRPVMKQLYIIDEDLFVYKDTDVSPIALRGSVTSCGLELVNYWACWDKKEATTVRSDGSRIFP